MANILLTNVKVNGADLSEDGITDVMVFTRLTPETLAAAWRNEGSITFDECYPVPDRDVQYYLYEPCHLSEPQERRAIALANHPAHASTKG